MVRARLQFGRRRGLSVVEAVVAAMLLSFVVAATAQLLAVGQAQQRIARNYSDAQTDLREALVRSTRAIRHGYAVKNPSADVGAVANYPNLTSTTTQLIVEVPEPTGALSERVQLRFHVTNGTFYAQRSDETAPGTELIEDVDSIVFSYWRTTGTTRIPVNDTTGANTPSTATEVDIRLIAVRDNAETPVSTLVTLRNSIAGSL